MTEVAKVRSASDITWCAEFKDGRTYYFTKREFRDEPDLDPAIADYAQHNSDVAEFIHAALTAIRDHEMALA